jgi:hypothetical protein
MTNERHEKALEAAEPEWIEWIPPTKLSTESSAMIASIRNISDEMLQQLWLSDQIPYDRYADEITRRTAKPVRDTLTKFVKRLNMAAGDEIGV